MCPCLRNLIPYMVLLLVFDIVGILSTSAQSTKRSAESHNYCTVRRPNAPSVLINENESRRLYREDRRSCSELCSCLPDNKPVPSCAAIACLERTPCNWKHRNNKTLVYQHEEPMYSAELGQCICYSANFICMRPSRENYILPPGVFLFLGYSQLDEKLLNVHTGLDANNVVDELSKLIDPQLHYHRFVNPSSEKASEFDVFKKLSTAECHLKLLTKEKENLIISATISRQIDEAKPDQLSKEKEQCLPTISEIANLINSESFFITSHPLLSILKLAEIKIVDEKEIPRLSSSSDYNSSLVDFSFIQSLINFLTTTYYIL